MQIFNGCYIFAPFAHGKAEGMKTFFVAVSPLLFSVLFLFCIFFVLLLFASFCFVCFDIFRFSAGVAHFWHSRFDRAKAAIPEPRNTYAPAPPHYICLNFPSNLLLFSASSSSRCPLRLLHWVSGQWKRNAFPRSSTARALEVRQGLVGVKRSAQVLYVLFLLEFIFDFFR